MGDQALVQLAGEHRDAVHHGDGAAGVAGQRPAAGEPGNAAGAVQQAETAGRR